MNSADVENFLRPMLQNMNIIGSRGPPKFWVFPAMLSAVVILVLFIITCVNVYEFAFTHTCPLCSKKHHS